MSRRPVSTALLLDHPAYPCPLPAGDEARPNLEGLVSIKSLARAERRRAAVQLLAAAALGAEFDLWPGKGAIRRAKARRGGEGVQAILGDFPIGLEDVHRRLGGGDRALEVTREATLEGVAEVTGLSIHDLRPAEGPGYFLEGALRRRLAELKRPLDSGTGRNLWAFLWPVPGLPDEGEVLFLRVNRFDLMSRLAGAAWARLRELGREAHFTDADLPESAGSDAVAVLMGRLSHERLAALEEWSRIETRSAVVVGTFPPGWDPPSPPGCVGALSRQLAVTGVTLDRARREVEKRDHHFDPSAIGDRESLTRAACRLFEESSQVMQQGAGGGSDRIFRLLSLRPEGMQLCALDRIGGIGINEMSRRVSEGQVVVDGELWRLPDPPKLRKDPLHEQVAELFSEGDPRRLLHSALSGRSPSDLENWAREKLDRLENSQVSELLGEVEPAELGPGIAALRIEASLAELDLRGAREGCSGLEDVDASVWRLWIDLEDLAGNWITPDSGLLRSAEGVSRVAAELAIHALRTRRKRAADLNFDPEELLRRAIEALDGDLKRWYEILGVAATTPKKLGDSNWRSQVGNNNPKLNALIARKYALLLTAQGDVKAARDILQQLALAERSPGRLGHIHLDLSIVAEDPRGETAHLLRALRYLEAGGFRHAIKKPLFNLGAIDAERLKVDRAQSRIEAVAPEDSALRLTVEAQIALGRGRLDELEAILEKFPDAWEETTDARVVAGVEAMRGAHALFEGRHVDARKHLRQGGEDGEGWLLVLDALEGGQNEGSARWDPWRLTRLAAMIREARRFGQPATTDGKDPADLFDAMGIAMADRLLRSPRWPLAEACRRCASVLEEGGLDGWAGGLSTRDGGSLESFLVALARLAEAGAPDSLSDYERMAILHELGVTGIRVQNPLTGKEIWEIGDGDERSPVRRGSLEVVPLGTESSAAGRWRLFCSVVAGSTPIRASEAVDPRGEDLGILGNSPPIEATIRRLKKVAPSGLTVLLGGETGVGKDLAAHAIHILSKRKGALVTVNVASITETLFEAELFGSVRGAYTGADRDRPGLVEEADRGTLFLDEIGDLALSLQVKLLRFLDSGEVRRVGSGRTRKVDVRVVAASHRNLEAAVAEGSFREDLYYRVVSAEILIPPLRERGDDVFLLRDLFEERAVRDQGLAWARWSPEADDLMRQHQWPGNVRELRRAVENALLAADGGVVLPHHLPFAGKIETAAVRTESPQKWDEAHRKLRIELLCASLERLAGNRTGAARELGITRQTLLYHLKQLGID